MKSNLRCSLLAVLSSALVASCVSISSVGPDRVGVEPGAGAENVATILPVNGRLGYIGVLTVNGGEVRGLHGVVVPPGRHALELLAFESDDNPVRRTFRKATAKIDVDVEAGHSYALQREDEGGTSERLIIKVYDLGKGKHCNYASGGLAGYLTCDGQMVYLY